MVWSKVRSIVKGRISYNVNNTIQFTKKDDLTTMLLLLALVVASNFQIAKLSECIF